jgi:16S rRNA (uracil1498-N3)-methyltransferase
VTRAPIPDLAAGEHRLQGPVAHYLARVLRLRAGDAFVAFDPQTAGEATAVIVWTDLDSITVRFGPLREGTPRALHEVTWIQGLAKADKCDSVVRDATELGAARVLVAFTHRSVVKLDAARAADRQARWARIASEAARQCGRSEAPRIDVPCPWSEALARTIDADGARQDARFCLWELATAPLAPPLFEALERGVPIAFACGAEGGLEAREVDEARSAGWRVVSLGPLVLRTETVAAAVLGAVRVWSGLGDRREVDPLVPSSTLIGR